ncbi:MAG: beta-glucosidase [Bacteroidetes bacterium]|nr:beta-glucosidase [Bacteroidota bacterium]
MRLFIALLLLFGIFTGGNCNKPNPVPPPPPPVLALTLRSATLMGQDFYEGKHNVGRAGVIRLLFSAPVNRATTSNTLIYTDGIGDAIPFSLNYERGDSQLLIQPSAALAGISLHKFKVLTTLKSVNGGSFTAGFDKSFITAIDSSRKFPTLTNEQLLDRVQQQTFKYFWDFAHPVSGLARERNTSGEIVTSGGSGFGLMAIVTAINRGFITRAQGLARLQTIVGFLKNTAQTFHGAYPHWLNGTTGIVVPFSAKDNGADLVETSYLIQGLLTVRQFFNDPGTAELTLRNDINTIAERVEWNWFRKNNEQVLYWHWSPNYNWDMNMPIRGWNECLITYVLAASSTTYGIPATVYHNGWARNGAIVNGNTYYGHTLPLGETAGGPLFFSHYSFLGINPNGLSDTYANYQTQTRNHTLINQGYCMANQNGASGYSDSVWGLTASDIQDGYTASSPTNDRGVIAPTAALSSFPYTPAESMAALQFFYYVLGDKIWKSYGFVDAFSLGTPWFASSFLAIDQGPIIIMIENYRSGLLWNLFTSCPEVKAGMRNLGFTAPYL